MSEKQKNELALEILGEERRVIQERVKRVENGLLQVKLEKNQPTPNFEEKGTIQERMKAYNVPGVCIAVISNYMIDWVKSYGIKDVRTKQKVTLNTLFEAGSTSKAITAGAALQFIEKKKIDLTEDVNNKLKSWKAPENEFTNEKKVTLEHLLTHTAGINRPDSLFDIEEGKIPTLNQVLNGEPPAINDPVDVVFTPGSNHQYSNFGYVIIQKLLEDVSGKSFPEIMKEVVFEPIAMKNSSFEYPSEEEIKKMVSPHDQNGEAKKTGLHPTAYAQGGLITTPKDLAKYVTELMHAYHDTSSKILSSTFVKKMLSPALPLDPAKFFGFTGQGLGTFLIEKEKELFFIHPGTNAPGAVCVMIGSPTTGQGAVVMSNGIRGELLNLEILFSVAQEYNWPIWP